MKHPNAFYVGDEVKVKDGKWYSWGKIRAFKRDPEMVEVEYVDGSVRLRPFSALRRAR
jgi:uncharacterized protein YodC (DUF2158 family)